MRFLTRIYTVILVLVVSFLFMLMFFINDSVKLMDDNDNQLYIPKNAVFVAKINSSKLIKLTIDDVLSSKDKDLLKELESLKFKPGESAFNGINLASNVYYIITPSNGGYAEGLLFNIIDKEVFQEAFLNEDRFVAFANDEVGILLFKDKTNSEALTKLSESLIQSPQNSELKIDFTDDGSIISTWSSNPSDDYPFSNDISLKFENESILLEGMMITNQPIGKEHVYLRRKGISFNTCLIPKEINDSVHNYLNSIGFLDTLVINSVSMNYEGVNFEQGEKFSIIPNVELLLDLKSDLNWMELAKDLEEHKMIQSIDSSRYIFNEIEFTVAQPAPNQLVIFTGASYSPAEVRNQLFEFSGDPSLLFRVGGNSPYGQFLNFIPMFRGGKQLTEATETIDIKIEQNGNKDYMVKGILEFKEGYSPIVELIRFLNNSALLK